MNNQQIPHPLAEKLKQARGKEFTRLYKQLYQQSGKLLEAEARQIIEKKGGLSIRDVAKLAIRFNLQLKHAFEFLEGRGVLATGTYCRLQNRGLKVSEAMKAAREEQP